MIKTDYHTHTDMSIDSKAKMEDMVKAAIQKGLKEMVFTDHKDVAAKSNDVLAYTHKDYEDYKERLDSLQETYKNDINLKWGIEIGMAIEHQEEIASFLEKYPFEFIIGSIHEIEESEIYTGEYFEGMSKHEAYEAYFGCLYEAAKVTDVDVIGHFDYVPRYVSFDDKSLDYKNHKRIIDKTFKMLIDKGVGIEINTSGNQYNLPHHHPQVEILKVYKKLGGEIITVGSDAHRPEDIARYFDEAKKMLEEAGFDYYTRFEKRKPYKEML